MSADRRGNLRVVILTSTVGAGHNGPARELASRLTAAGQDVEVVDLIDIASVGIGKLYRWVFHAQLCWAPGSWGRLFRAMQRSSGLPSIAGLLVATVGRPNSARLARSLASSLSAG